jgi:hypothetical protein
MIRRRTHPRRTSVVLLKGEALAEFRQFIWQRDGHRCVWCGKWVPLECDDPFKKMDLAHYPRPRHVGGDVPENAVCACHECHMKDHSGGKPCPPKPKAEERKGSHE